MALLFKINSYLACGVVCTRMFGVGGAGEFLWGGEGGVGERNISISVSVPRMMPHVSVATVLL